MAELKESDVFDARADKVLRSNNRNADDRIRRWREHLQGNGFVAKQVLKSRQVYQPMSDDEKVGFLFLIVVGMILFEVIF